MSTATDLARKLQLRDGQRIAVLNPPSDASLPIAREWIASQPGNADGVLLFVRDAAELRLTRGSVLDAARRESPAWIAYPKAGQLGTDLNRDRLAAAMLENGVEPVRQVSVDAVWSALRFRLERSHSETRGIA